MAGSTVLVDSFVELSDSGSGLPPSVSHETALFFPAHAHSPFVYLRPGIRTILGRGDLFGSQQPDIDLTLYAAIENGVSRIHAAIEWFGDTAVITDLGSKNGTMLNGVPLIPQQSYCLQDRDEIYLGELMAYLLLR